MSQDLNHVLLIGRLTRDMEMKYTNGGMAIGNFSLAVNKRRKQGDEWVDECSFFDVKIFGKTAESLNQYLVKGKQVAVEGELHQNRWEKDGKTMSKVEVNANNVQLLGGDKNGQQSTQSAAPAQGYQKRAASPVKPAGNAADESFDDFEDDPIPF